MALTKPSCQQSDRLIAPISRAVVRTGRVRRANLSTQTRLALAHAHAVHAAKQIVKGDDSRRARGRGIASGARAVRDSATAARRGVTDFSRTSSRCHVDLDVVRRAPLAASCATYAGGSRRARRRVGAVRW